MPFFNAGHLGIHQQTINYVGETMRMMVMNSTYTFDPASATVSAITANEQTTFTRQDLAGKTITANTAATPNRIEYRSTDPVTFPSVSAGTAPSGYVLFKFVTNDADSIPVWFGTFSAANAPNGNDYDVNMPTEGWAFDNAVGTA